MGAPPDEKEWTDRSSLHLGPRSSVLAEHASEERRGRRVGPS
jgi:hypothetical protein